MIEFMIYIQYDWCKKGIITEMFSIAKNINLFDTDIDYK